MFESTACESAEAERDGKVMPQQKTAERITQQRTATDTATQKQQHNGAHADERCRDPIKGMQTERDTQTETDERVSHATTGGSGRRAAGGAGRVPGSAG